jgi:hypothetical protein
MVCVSVCVCCVVTGHTGYKDGANCSRIRAHAVSWTDVVMRRVGRRVGGCTGVQHDEDEDKDDKDEDEGEMGICDSSA